MNMNRMLTTKEASLATGLSEYELRLGAKQGRYPVLWLGSPDSSFRRMRWNLKKLEDAINSQMEHNVKMNDDDECNPDWDKK